MQHRDFLPELAESLKLAKNKNVAVELFQEMITYSLQNFSTPWQSSVERMIWDKILQLDAKNIATRPHFFRMFQTLSKKAGGWFIKVQGEKNPRFITSIEWGKHILKI